MNISLTFPARVTATQTTGSFNQWFHRNLEIDKLKEYYKRPDGSFRSWNITSPTNVAPKYWDNPYTEANENIRHNYIQTIYGQVTLNYNFMNGFKAGVIARGTLSKTPMVITALLPTRSIRLLSPLKKTNARKFPTSPISSTKKPSKIFLCAPAPGAS